MNLSFRRAKSDKGREVDTSLGILSGEAAGQRIKYREAAPGQKRLPVWDIVPSQQKAPADYYRLPVVKEPVWVWSVPTYFYVGGVAGGCAVLAAALQWQHDRRLKRLMELCRLLTFAGTSLGAAFLTYDLGKQSRFLNMLRVFRPTSPMSIGSWTLAEGGGLSLVALLLGNQRGAAGVVGRTAGYLMGANGIMLAGYTGVLLANSAVPIWRETGKGLPFLFVASAAASSAGLLELFPLDRREEKVANMYGIIGKAAELAGVKVIEAEAARRPHVVRPLKEGPSGKMWIASKLLMLGGLGLSVLPLRWRFKHRTAGALTTAGAILLRYALMEAGKASAREPLATISPQRMPTH